MTAVRRFRLLALLVATLVAVAACGGAPAPTSAPAAPAAPVTPEWQKVIDAAKAEGSVTIYSSQSADQLKDLAQRFQQAYGIRVDVLRDIDANLEAKVDAEHGSAQKFADVAAFADGAYVAAKGQQKWWTPPTGPDFTTPAYDKGYLKPDGSFVTTAAIFVPAWNTQTVPGGITGYQDLLKPELVGKIGVNDPATSPAVVDFYKYLTQLNGPTFVDQLAAQKPQIFASVLPMGQALISGQISVQLGGSAPTTQKEQGAPVDFLVPKPAWGAAFRTVVVGGSPHPNAAQLLANYMVTPEGQTALARDAGSVLKDIPGALTTVADVRVFDPASLSAADVSQFRALFRTKFQGGA